MSLRPTLRAGALLAAACLCPFLPARAEAPPDEPTPVAGWVPGEGFRIKSEDGAYLLRLALQAGFKLEPAWVDGERQLDSTFSVLRPVLRGNVVKPWLGYWVSVELSGSEPFLLDGYVDVNPVEELGVRFGQQYTPMSRHEAFGPQQIFFPDYARTANFFWSGYERGLTLYGTAGGERWLYYLGLYGGSPLREPVNASLNYVLEGRLSVSPLGPVNANEFPFTPEGGPLPPRVSFTVQGFHGKLQTSQENFNPDLGVARDPPSVLTLRTDTLGADVWLQAGRVIAFGEAYWSSRRPLADATAFSAYGAWGQVLVNAYRERIGVGARVNWVDPSSDLDSDQALSVEGQVAWFIHAPELVARLRYAWVDQRTPAADALGTFRLPYVAGTSHVATLQLMLSF